MAKKQKEEGVKWVPPEQTRQIYLDSKLEELLSISYLRGYSPTNKLHAIWEQNKCCPLTMFLLCKGEIKEGSEWAEVLSKGLEYFDGVELNGFLDAFDGTRPLITRFANVKGYSLGYSLGKKALLVYFGGK